MRNNLTFIQEFTGILHHKQEWEKNQKKSLAVTLQQILRVISERKRPD